MSEIEGSPYFGKEIDDWDNITKELLSEYPLSKEEILEIANICWDLLWNSVIGNEIKINDVELPATVVGYFFQKLFSHELSKRYKDKWSGEKLKNDKDFVYLENKYYSTEMKTSGQLGYELFGNRSYNQKTNNVGDKEKSKSGFYITLNFYQQKITLLRLGWIDQDDWVSQSSQSGQSAKLKPEVYKYKMVEIIGDYKKESPIGLLYGVGKKLIIYLNENKINTFNDLVNYKGSDKKILIIKNNNSDILESL